MLVAAVLKLRESSGAPVISGDLETAEGVSVGSSSKTASEAQRPFLRLLRDSEGYS
jgi:hypothetical protein